MNKDERSPTPGLTDNADHPTPRTDEVCSHYTMSRFTHSLNLYADRATALERHARDLERELIRAQELCLKAQDECLKAQRDLLAQLSAIPSERTHIGEVVGHKEFGMALVQWADNGLRPIGMKVYALAAPSVERLGSNREEAASRPAECTPTASPYDVSGAATKEYPGE